MSASKRDIYGNNGKIQPPQAPEENKTQSDDQQGIRINGFAQVVAMLEAADPQFRESLLRRLAQRDPRLVRSIREDMDL
jgi:hypothetical protein